MSDTRPDRLLRSLYDAAVKRAQPASVLPACLPSPPKGRTVVIGAGKASGAMARAFDALWPAELPLSGVVLTRYDHAPPCVGTGPQRIAVLEAAHPVPDQAGLDGSRAVMQALQGVTEDDLVVALMSGGGSALLTAPVSGWHLPDEQDLHRQLLRCGASITEMNTVRRHLSAIKGGRLARLCQPARLVTLAISDVPGDRLEDIASGPTVPDPTSCADTLRIVAQYGLQLSPVVMAQLASGELESLKPGDAAFDRHGAQLMATPQDMLEAAAQAAQAVGYRAHILSDRMEGEARDVGMLHAALALQVARHQQPFEAPCVLLSGGETTVTLSGCTMDEGSGGRCSELMLSAALALQGAPGIWMLAADTDGIDGMSDAAGAWIAPDTLARAQMLGLDPRAALQKHDSGRFFAALGDQVLTGPTFTNVNDFRAVLIT